MGIKKKVSKEEAVERLRYTCSRSEKCLFDIRKKLSEWSLEGEYDSISQNLLEEKFIDEERYTNSFVNDKIKFSKWGKLKVKYQLRMRGIDESIFVKALSDYSEVDYQKMIKNEIDKKNKSIKASDKYKRLQKLYAFAAQRGYETDIVREICDAFLIN